MIRFQPADDDDDGGDDDDDDDDDDGQFGEDKDADDGGKHWDDSVCVPVESSVSCCLSRWPVALRPSSLFLRVYYRKLK